MSKSKPIDLINNIYYYKKFKLIKKLFKKKKLTPREPPNKFEVSKQETKGSLWKGRTAQNHQNQFYDF